MSAIAAQESLVKESLFQFITQNVPNADLSLIDDIVLSYVISILEEASQDPCFDVEGFMEMMGAYMPEFCQIDSQEVLQWILKLEAELSRGSNDSINNDDSVSEDRLSITLQSLAEMLPCVTKTESRSNSESESIDSKPQLDLLLDELSEGCAALQDMFPNTCTMEIKHCITIAGGDIERAAATLLHRRDTGQSLSPATIAVATRQVAIGDQELKHRIIQRYSYVDKNAESKEHKPLAPKIEPKKMVRYRDNKIVSLKGERYTEVSKSGMDDENLKKPKRQHCP